MKKASLHAQLVIDQDHFAHSLASFQELVGVSDFSKGERVRVDEWAHLARLHQLVEIP